MPRHGFDGEEILWTGGPRLVQTPPLFEATGWVGFGIAIAAVAFACVRSAGLGQSPSGSLVFAAWAITTGMLARTVPRWWATGARYTVTQRSVIWQRGPFRRTLDRAAISYARITWSERAAHVGDLELVRAVPTGALWRRLSLRLEGLESPDGVLAIIRGAQSVASPGHGTLPIAQRLDRDEHVIWAARPLPSLRSYLPQTAEEWTLAFASLGLVVISIWMGFKLVGLEKKVLRAGYSVASISFWGLAIGMGAAVLVMFGTALFLAKSTLVRRARSLHETRYVISNKRVLIQRGREELHLERNRIIDVIDAPAGEGTRTLFLVIDGPRARALAIGGAFGEAEHGPDLHPVLECVRDSDGARRALPGGKNSVPPPQRHAA
jgi:hypothetical protein